LDRGITSQTEQKNSEWDVRSFETHGEDEIITSLNRAARGLSIRQRLTLIVLAVAIPLLALSAAIVWRLGESQRGTQRDAIMYASRSTLSAVDAQLGKYMVLAQALATSPSLQRDDLTGFREVAERGVPGLYGSWVVLADARGQQLVNTLVPAGKELAQENWTER
jgi:hypothetical protein